MSVRKPLTCPRLPSFRASEFATKLLHGLALTFITLQLHAQDSLKTVNLKKLSIEELMQIEVTSVSRGAEKLSEVASAIQVITREDILRSGATSVPEALRLAPNLQVAQVNASSWIISARGFNTVFANKLLVLIDGRTVYTPLYAGVIWDQQHVLLEDVDRIEVISGPGGTMWGANAVNGVINIITKTAKETPGLFASASLGNFVKKSAALRYGGHAGKKFFYKIFAQGQDRAESAIHNDTINSKDAWKLGQVGFRSGWYPNDKDFITIQGDVSLGALEAATAEAEFDAQNLLARWTRSLSDDSEIILQAYYDRYWRSDNLLLADELETFDIDFQHRFHVGSLHSLLWGAAYRFVQDHVINRTAFVGLLPTRKNLPVISAFIQDEIQFDSGVKFTFGTKLLHNVYSGFEIQPSVRGAWSINSHNTVWTSVSRAVRAPSRFDVDYYQPLEPQPDNVPSVAGGPNFDSEKLRAFEAGYRAQPNSKSSFSLALFYNEYRDIYSNEPLPGTYKFQIQNGSEAETWGGEFSGFIQATDWWRLKGGFTYFAKDLRAKPGRAHDPSYLANDPKHRVVLQSMIDLPANFQFDFVARYTDYLPATFATARVPEYFTFDARISWMTKKFELSIVGQNLYEKEHVQFNTVSIPQSAYAKAALRL